MSYFFSLGNSDRIFETESYKILSEKRGFVTEHKRIVKVESNIFPFLPSDTIPREMLHHHFFTRNEANLGFSIYLVERGDTLYKHFKATRLAHKLYPDAIKHKGWLLIEDN